MADVRILEHPTLKVPYESLNRKFRNAQKNIDREISHVNAAATKIGASLVDDSSAESVSELLCSMVAKLKVLKRKAAEAMEDETEAAKVCRRRLSHLQNYENLSESEQALWRKKRLDRMLVEYCLRLGYYDTALKLATHSDIKELTNVDIFMHSKTIEKALLSHQTGPCLTWCHENKTKLRKSRSTLELSLREQEFVELIKEQNRMEAVRHARKYFGSVEPAFLHRIQRLMGLLAFTVDTTVYPYAELFSEDRWVSLIEQFRKENFGLHQISGNSVFLVSLQCGLSALKTPQCYKEGTKNTNCPVCSRNFNELAKEFPRSHCSHSKLVCSMSGEVLNEHNPPMALPNGHVYGTKALEEMAKENDGRITCPRTKRVFMLSDAEKVFIM
ncbi:E3 ubiquitin-protein transferase MAEA-like [Watersipora subatra]|uniref:E3 ubiquitin-protein transferase MAEA-like n=1 Tax=Watersipora subatra TaxID=2589382 RepID=UPI00355C86CD